MAARALIDAPPVDIRSLTPTQKIAAFYAMGRLDWKVRQYQLADYWAWRRWNTMRQLDGYQEYIEDIGALFDFLWVDECGRRYGKTAQWLIRDVEEAIRRPGLRGLIACAFQKNIGEIIVPLTKKLFADAPPEYFPRYHGTKGAEHECLYIEATDSTIKLVGVDKHPDATRGQFLDFAHISEACFVDGLEALVTETIVHQFQGRPWAWMAQESSTAKVPDCDFNRVFRPDAILRAAYRKHTIRENTTLTEQDIRKEERRSGGSTSSACRRELYCEEVRDPDEMVIPEFSEAVHVVDPAAWPDPQYAFAYTGVDPGTTDPLGLVFGYQHFARGAIVIQSSWQKSNASTGEVAAVIRATENRLWGTEHLIPGKKGKFLTMPAAEANGAGKIWAAPEGALMHWDTNTQTLRPNPGSRVSDIANRFVLDLNMDHAIEIHRADKSPGSADADIQHLRTLFEGRNPDGSPKIVILRNKHTETLIAQLRSGMWKTDETGHRKDWQRTAAMGHLDCLAALKYMCREISFTRNPNVPAHIGLDPSDRHIPQKVRQQIKPGPAVGQGGREIHHIAGSRR